MAGNILVVYALRQFPVRNAVRDHLYSFARYSRNRCFYLNVALRAVPRWVRRVPFDAVIFHNSFLSFRWAPDLYFDLLEHAAPLRNVGKARAAIVQDEFLRSNLVCDFIEDFGIGHVFSAAPRSEWPKIYDRVDRERVGFTRVLTGYLDPRSVKRAERIAASIPERPLDIGYRSRHMAPWLGRHGQLKGRIADVVREAAPRHGLRVDISTEAEDTLYGDDWYRFLGSCNYTIGVEGGASVLDRDGSFKTATERYLVEHPKATFEKVEAACFPGQDGKLSLFAISPRHLEACATRTCQLLVEGDYNGILRPGEHYIPIRPDLSDLEDALEELGSDERRRQIVETAHRDVVASGRYQYSRFVAEVEDAVTGPAPSGASRALWSYSAALAGDRASWLELWWSFEGAVRLRPLLSLAARLRAWAFAAARRVLPESILELIRRRRDGKAGSSR
ncbi:MAG TPA: glycosyltransferase [Solirubrobacterales bacterium]